MSSDAKTSPAQRWAAVRADDGTTLLTPWCSSPEDALVSWEELRSGDCADLEIEAISMEELGSRLLPADYS